MADLYVFTHLLWLQYRWSLYIYIVFASVVYGMYLRTQENDKWWIGCIPVAGKIQQRFIAGVPIVMLVITRVLWLLFFVIDISPLTLLVCVLLTIIEDTIFARNYTEFNSIVYGVIPLAKYVFMIKEILECKSTTKVKNTKKKSSQKTSSTKAKKTQSRA